MLLHKSVEFDSRVRREASALAAAGHRVTVVELAEVPAGGRTLDGFSRRSCLPSAWVRRRLPFALYRVVFAGALLRAAVATRPDVVHAHDAAMLMPGIAAARMTGARAVYDSHELATSVPYRERTWAWFVSAVERMVVPRCDAVITVSEGIARALQQRYQLPVTPTVVRNVTALGRNGAGGLRARIGLPADAPLVLYQGAPAPDRGCESLVAAVARTPGVSLVFLGDPESGYGRKLALLIYASGAADRVWMLPSVPLEDLLSHTAEADIGVTLLQDTCENHRLALPNKLFEYVAAGLPVIASRLPETERLVQAYGIGWCVAPGDVAALADAITAALAARNDAGLRDRLQRAARELSWDRERARLTALYDSLSAGGSARRRRTRVAE